MTVDQLSLQGRNNKIRVLVTDDSKLVRATAKKILSEKFDLVLAEDGEQAWDKISHDKTIQVVFTDLGMPALDGFGLIRRVRMSEDEGIRHLPVIVITGASDEDVRREVFEIGATDFITKPFKPATIIARANAHANYRADNNQLKKNTNIDLLTGVLNHNGLFEQLDKDISFVNRHRENMAVMIVELDDFEHIYDQVGQSNSDHIIKDVASVLRKTIRTEDSIGRDGLARFVFSLPMAKSDGVVKLARRLCAKIDAVSLKLGQKRLPLSASVGISAVIKGNLATTDELFTCAEKALANARALGSGEVQFLKLEARGGAHNNAVVSIDRLLDCLEQGQQALDEVQIAAAARRLAPLLKLLPESVDKNP